MFDLNILIEQDSMSPLAYTKPEFDILYRGFRISLEIKTSHLIKDLFSDGTAASPEGKGFLIPLLVMVMMK
jgi:hypothetical protein